jgi:hypothetical protein
MVLPLWLREYVRVYLVCYIFCIIDYHICYDIFDMIDIIYYRLHIYLKMHYLTILLYSIYTSQETQYNTSHNYIHYILPTVSKTSAEWWLGLMREKNLHCHFQNILGNVSCTVAFWSTYGWCFHRNRSQADYLRPVSRKASGRWICGGLIQSLLGYYKDKYHHYFLVYLQPSHGPTPKVKLDIADFVA